MTGRQIRYNLFLYIIITVLASKSGAVEEQLFDFTTSEPGDWSIAVYTDAKKNTAAGNEFHIRTGKIPETDSRFMGVNLKDKVLPELSGKFPPADTKSRLLISILPGSAARITNTGVLKSLSISLYSSGAPVSVSVLLEDQDKAEHIFFLGYLNFTGMRRLTWVNPLYIEEVRKIELNRQEVDAARLLFYQFRALIIKHEKNQPWFYPDYRENYKFRYIEQHYPGVTTKQYRQLLNTLDPAILDAAITGESFTLYILDISINYDQAVFPLPVSKRGGR